MLFKYSIHFSHQTPMRSRDASPTKLTPAYAKRANRKMTKQMMSVQLLPENELPVTFQNSKTIRRCYLFLMGPPKFGSLFLASINEIILRISTGL